MTSLVAVIWLAAQVLPADLAQAPGACASAPQHRISQNHAAQGAVGPALEAIERALATSPDCVIYLRAHAALATWAGEYERAQNTYRQLRLLVPGDTTLALDLARVNAWGGSTDDAVREYRAYLGSHPGDASVWLELARTESWRGNFAGALDVLAHYRTQFGESRGYSRELAGTLARGGRPRTATRLVDGLPHDPDDAYHLGMSRAVALAFQQRRSEALSAFEQVKQIRPDQRETNEAEGLLRVTLASTAEPRATTYGDSDGLRVQRFTPRVSAAVLGGTRIEGGYEWVDLRARAESGLETMTGGLTARQATGWAGLSQRVGEVTFQARAGLATAEGKRLFTYDVGAQVHPSDTFQLTVSRRRGFLVISPRTVALGLTRLAHTAGIEWFPSLRSALTIEATIEELSDSNRRWDVLIAPRRVIARTERWNLDLGVQLRQFGATTDMDHGYYDPNRYESYSVTAYPYWKISENAGLALFAALGAQRDDAWGSFRPGGSVVAEATVGIFRRWMLKVSGAATVNERTDSGAFRAYGGSVLLVRRF